MGKLNGGGADSGGSGAYPGWVGYIEYDDATGEVIAADYSGLEIGGVVPNSLKFNRIKFRGDWKGSIGKFTDGTEMFDSCSNLTSFNGDLSSLMIGNRMFYGCSNLTSFTSDLSSLMNGSQMFDSCSNLTSFSSDLSSLTRGASMFSYCSNLTSFSSDLSSLTDGSNMFSYCSNLTSFSSDLSSLTSGSSMFNNCKLDAPSVERILTTIPEYTDGSSHTLSMRVQSGEAAAKFGEITGTTPNFAIRNVNFKGWTITVNTKN